jgi:LysM repeat protein
MAEVAQQVSATTLPQMNRTGLALLAAALVALPVSTVACGSSDGAAEVTLPPIATTTSTTIAITTTTEYVPVTYEIQPGDGLRNIADKFGVDLDKLAILNGIKNYDDIQAGDMLDIPPPTMPTTLPPTSTSSTTTSTIPLPTLAP